MQERHLDHPTARSRQGRLLNNSSDKEVHNYQRQHLITTCISTPLTLTSVNPAIIFSFYASLPLVVSGKAPVLFSSSIYVIVIPFHVTCPRACIGVDLNFWLPDSSRIATSRQYRNSQCNTANRITTVKNISKENFNNSICLIHKLHRPFWIYRTHQDTNVRQQNTE